MKYCIEYNSLYAAAEAWGCEDDFSPEGWDYLEELLDETHGSEEAFSAMGDLKYDFRECAVENWAAEVGAEVPEGVDLQELDADALAYFLCDEDCADTAYETSAGLCVLCHVCYQGRCPDEDRWREFLTEQGLIEDDDDEEEEEA